jgi:hypothetical protein
MRQTAGEGGWLCQMRAQVAGQVLDHTVDVAGGHLWTNGTFWGAAGAVAVVLSIVVLAWVAIRVAKPKRQLWCSLKPPAPLIVNRPGLSRELRVMYGDDQVVAPHTVSVELKSRGRRIDIPSAAFDKGQPLVIDVGVTILEILESTTGPDRTLPKLAYKDSNLLIGPSLIKWDRSIIISLLTEGRPNLGPLNQQLENVDIRNGDPSREPTIATRSLVWVTPVYNSARWYLAPYLD